VLVKVISSKTKATAKLSIFKINNQLQFILFVRWSNFRQLYIWSRNVRFNLCIKEGQSSRRCRPTCVEKHMKNDSCSITTSVLIRLQSLKTVQ
jgi:hypothetical protein